ncbi:hypothetical protein [Methylomonas rhizoryzae]|uniref:hypothetical protein n=1 Tax=Methylomonas rhizoryzae TaxID=2608981 RepID=UPI0012326A78|nr:hypothetical protein [Methylomonas rhizoryzae]
MTTIQIKLKDVYVDRLLAIISEHDEIPIEAIAVDGTAETSNLDKQNKKRTLLRIAKACADLPTLDTSSTDAILGYASSESGLWGND